MIITPQIHLPHAAFLVRTGDRDDPPVAAQVLCPAARLSLAAMAAIVHGEPIGGLTDRPGADDATYEVLYVPDEPDVPGLLYRAERTGPDGRWLMVSHPDGPGPLQRSFIERAPLEPEWVTAIDGAPDEASLISAWGRTLSLRAYMAAFLLDTGEAVRAAQVAPGQVAIAMRLDHPDAHGAEDPERFTQLLAPHLSLDQLGFEAKLAWASLDNGPFGWRSWAGPAADLMADGTLRVLFAVDPARIRAAVDLAAARVGAQSAHEPPLPEGFEMSEDETSGALALASEDPDGERMWFACAHGGHLWISADEVASFAAGRGHTIAEAAAMLIAERDEMVRIGVSAGAEYTERTGKGAHLIDHERLRIRNATGVGEINLALNLLRMAPDEITDHAVRMHDDIGAFWSGEGLDMTGRWFGLQLRPRSWVAQRMPELSAPFVRNLTDDAGGENAAVLATLETEQSAMFLSAQTMEALPAEYRDRDVLELCEEHVERVRMQAALSTVAERPPRGPMCVIHGSNISAVLAHERLLAGLIGALARAGVVLDGPLIAYAGHVDLLFVGAHTDDMTHRLDLANDEADARGWRESPPLRFVRLPNGLAAPAGTFALTVL